MMVSRRGFHASAFCMRVWETKQHAKIDFGTKERTKAWVKAGVDKDEYFKKFAHIHVEQKKRRDEIKQKREQKVARSDVYKLKGSLDAKRISNPRNGSDGKSDQQNEQFDQYFGDNYKPARFTGPTHTGNRFEERRRSEYGRRGDDRGGRRLDSSSYRNSSPRLEPEPWKYILHGTGAVIGALTANKRPFTKLFTLSEPKSTIAKLVRERNVPVEKVSRLEMNELTRGAIHNGVALETRPLNVPDIAHLGPVSESSYSIGLLQPSLVTETKNIKNGRKHPLGVYVDEVTDTHNMGAVIRSAYYLGADFLVMSQKNCCKLTPAVAKSAVGALDLYDVYNAHKPLNFFADSVANGWDIIATFPEGDKKAQGLTKVKCSELSQMLEKKPCLLVLGSEGEGLRKSLATRATHSVSLTPGGDKSEVVDSLNVSVATALILSRFFNPTDFD